MGLYVENSVGKVGKEIGIPKQKDLPEEMIDGSDYDNLTEDLEKKRKFKETVGNLLRDDNLMVNDDITQDTIIKEFNYTKDSKNEKLGDKEDIAYRKQLSTGSLKQVEDIIRRQRKVLAEKKSNNITP